MIEPQLAYTQWYWGVGGQKNGPVSLPQLQAMMRAGQLGPQVMVWTEGMPEWAQAASLPVLHQQTYGQADGGALNLLLPMGPQSGLAIAAGYCGLVGLIFGLAAPAGIILGFFALRDLNRNPQKRGKGRAWTGIILGGLMSAVWIIILIAALTSRHRY